MIYIMTGLSGVGKTSVAKQLSKVTGIPISVRYTTRPMRPGEINGVDYNFVSNINDKDFIGVESYLVANGDTWKYASKRDEIKDNCIIVCNPKAVEKLKADNVQFVDFEITVNEQERLNRILKRNDNQGEKEILRRDKADKAIFANYHPKFKISNDKSIDETVNKIVSFFKTTCKQNSLSGNK